MAKEKEAEKPKEEKAEKQVPEKPKGKPGELGLMQILIVIGGTAVLLFVLFIVGYIFIVKPDLQNIEEPGKDKAKSENVKKGDEAKNEDLNEFAKEEFERFVATGRITTNPKMSSQFVIVDLGIEFYVHEELAKEVKKEKTEESPGMNKVLASVKGEVNNILGAMTVEELQSIRRDSLQSVFKAKLKPVLKKSRMLLKDAIIQEFIIQ